MDNKEYSSREAFDETWLKETPQGLGTFETYDSLVYHIKDLINSNVKVQSLSDNLKKIDLPQTLYYWYQTINGTILLGVSLEKRPQGLVVTVTGKNPNWRGRSPWASDLYNIVLNDNKTKSLRLLSDESLSDEGKKIWDRLLRQGNKISVYDQYHPGTTFKTFSSQEEMDEFFQHDDTNFKRYQYILSSPGETIAETRSFFNTRRYRELIPGML